MALYLPVRAFNRSQNVRIGGQRIIATATSYIDISDINTRKELGYHSAIGAVLVLGPVTPSNTSARIVSGASVTQGTTAADRSLRVLAGELRTNNGVYVAIAQQDLTITPGHATLTRIDLIVVSITTGVAAVVVGTAATTPVAPDVTAGTIPLASVNVVPVSGPGGTNEVQSVAVDATSGSYTLTFSAQTTASILFNASDTTGAASVRAKLEALSTIGVGNVAVVGGPGNSGGTVPYVVTFQGTLAETDVTQMTADSTSLAGGGHTATVSTTTPGSPAGIANASITDIRPR